MTIHTRPRAGSYALVPGLSLWPRRSSEYSTTWTLQAVAQVEGRQALRRWGLLKWGLGPALEQAAAFRYAHAPEGWESAAAMAEAARGAIPRETLDQLRAAGVEV